ncbi:ORF-147 [Agrotis segetum nucleopolyhedrovirus A]|uniref:ORF-147 n=1 Tax=Agrotis segetum nuclear polyhedrosis virus TaxID=1962501 RepID=Q287C5_NPVAS|nr:ORF-147 [Agrotis segetum nucleopolyhedrovirus A]AAZ38313.1 ORF-147 [Agrotis segetum nucleopolyhedrovirus A]
MNVNLYRASDNENLMSFNVLHTVNSIKVFIFQMGPPAAELSVTRLVSGYEQGLRSVCMKMQCVSSYDRQAYLISCVRAPYVLRRLIESKNFTRPVAPIVVQCGSETQVWHVFSVCKGKELASIARVRGVTVCENGVEAFIAKELIALTGNLPSAFVAALSRNAPNAQDVDVIKIIYPGLIVNVEDVIVEAK